MQLDGLAFSLRPARVQPGDVLTEPGTYWSGDNEIIIRPPSTSGGHVARYGCGFPGLPYLDFTPGGSPHYCERVVITPSGGAAVSVANLGTFGDLQYIGHQTRILRQLETLVFGRPFTPDAKFGGVAGAYTLYIQGLGYVLLAAMAAFAIYNLYRIGCAVL